MPYTYESNTDPANLGRREQEKNWKRRNSDFKNTFEGDITQATPAFTITESALPMSTTTRITDREDPEGVAERHTHVYGVIQPDWVVEP
ncbi:MAG: hypothetical protein H0U59_10735 [Gemmatimonadaceae bacterium]|nr:hypothetical protein [Gemmatimonadaceae bacterium]